MIPPPPTPVLAAIIAGLAMPFLLAVFARLPLRNAKLSHRFWLAMATSLLMWVLISLFAVGPDGVPHVRQFQYADSMAGGLVLATAALIAYSVWSLACFGFTISMLLILYEHGKPMTLDEWANSYGNGRGIPGLTRDRFSVLVRMKLATIDGENLHISPAARAFGRFVAFLSRIFAVRSN